MPFEINNKLAEKWTLDATKELCKRALSVISDECFYLSAVADECDTYRELFEYLLKKYNEDEYVFSTIKKIHNKCERIVAEKTGKGEIAVPLGIFILKAYHGLFETSKLNTDLKIEPIEGFHFTIDDPQNTITPETGPSINSTYRSKI